MTARLRHLKCVGSTCTSRLQCVCVCVCRWLQRGLDTVIETMVELKQVRTSVFPTMPPLWKPEPVIVTRVPPPIDPLFGVREDNLHVMRATVGVSGGVLIKHIRARARAVLVSTMIRGLELIGRAHTQLA